MRVFAFLCILSLSCAQHAPPLAATSAKLPPPRVVAGELDARALLGELPARAARVGAGELSIVASGEALEMEWMGGFVEVPSDACLLGYARASPSIEDVDVAVYADDGTQLAADEARDVHPTVLVCPPHPDRVYVAAHVIEGEGLVAAGAQLVPRDRAVVVGRALGARGTFAEGPRPAEAWPGLEDRVREHRLALGGTWEEFKRVLLSVDPREPTAVALPIEADQCVDAVILPGEGVAMLDVEALDGAGRVVARAREGAGERALTVCSSFAMDGSLAIRPHVGRGLAAVVLARARGETARDLTEQPEVAWAAATKPLDAAKTERNELLAKSGYEAPVAATAGTLSLGRRVSVPLDLKPLGGACARVDVVAGAPLAFVSARAWDDSGALVGSSDSGSSLALFVCARGAARLDLETRGRPGPFAVTVRAERWKDPAFAARPLAAARMLSRAAIGPQMLIDGRESPVRAAILDASHATIWQTTIGAGKCVRATVGAQGDGAGVELRAFDASDGAEIDRSEAAAAAGVRACASPEAPRAVRFEVRASAGKLDAIIGERTSG